MPGNPKSKSGGKSRGNPRQEIARGIADRNREEAQLRESNERAIWLAQLSNENPNPVMRVSADERRNQKNIFRERSVIK